MLSGARPRLGGTRLRLASRNLTVAVTIKPDLKLRLAQPGPRRRAGQRPADSVMLMATVGHPGPGRVALKLIMIRAGDGGPPAGLRYSGKK